MKVKVCDAICGAGKTQSCIKMMNDEINQRFIFITPYLTEVERIKSSCSGRGFVSPEATYSNNFSKLEDLNNLLKQQLNIASTHALFSYYTDETRDLIIKGGYTLVLDEVMNLFQPVDVSNADMNILLKSQTVKPNDNEFVWDDEEYDGGTFADIMFKARSNNLLKYREEMYFWSIPPDLFKCFKEVYLLTYMFEFQLQKYFFDVYGIEYELIGTKRANGEFVFCPIDEMDRRVDLRDKIHILDNPRLNSIGEEEGALSLNWFKRTKTNEPEKLNILKNNISNVFKHIYPSKEKDRMWSTFKTFKEELQDKGYKNSFVTYNKRATNDYIHKKYLAYCLNVYMQTWAKNYLIDMGAKNISENMFAISTLIQWLFRSAIRKGEDVYLYLPSRRMRSIFTIWLDNLAQGKDLEIIKLTKRTMDRKSKLKIHQFRGSLKNNEQ